MFKGRHIHFTALSICADCIRQIFSRFSTWSGQPGLLFVDFCEVASRHTASRPGFVAAKASSQTCVCHSVLASRVISRGFRFLPHGQAVTMLDRRVRNTYISATVVEVVNSSCRILSRSFFISRHSSYDASFASLHTNTRRPSQSGHVASSKAENSFSTHKSSPFWTRFQRMSAARITIVEA